MATTFRYFGSRALGAPAGKSNPFIWAFNGAHVFRVGVPHALTVPNAAFQPTDSSDLIEEIRSFLSGALPSEGPWDIAEMKLPPGGHYPRIARPHDQHPDSSPGSPGWSAAPLKLRDELASLLGQLGSLIGQLERIFAIVHPIGANLPAYGHEIRNLLILACTEVEAQWRAVLQANGYKSGRLTTEDYVLLEPAMRLGEYSVELPGQPWLPPVAPFAGWGSTGKPTQDLAWYDAYNAVKHDRESNFRRATLENAIYAVAACWIMLNAQFGFHARDKRPDVDRFFNLAGRPQWPYCEVYTHPYGYFGTPAAEYPVNYPF